MHIRPYQTHDSLALATVKASCDLSDPLALYCRRVATTPSASCHQPGPEQEQEHGAKDKNKDKQWKAHVKSIRRSLELELLLPGDICWVVVSDDDNDRNKEKIVGFAIWVRHGSSSEAMKWKAEGHRLVRRIKAFLAYIQIIITYPFDKSINHTHMAQFQQRVRSSGSQNRQRNNDNTDYQEQQQQFKQSPPTPADERWELEALYIDPRYQRRGYGSMALQWGIEMARKENVEIWVWSTQAGKRLYENGGFGVVDRVGFEDLVTASDGLGEESENAAVWVMVWRGS